MLKKLYISLIFSTLVVSNPLGGIIIDIRNFVTKFGKILEICRKSCKREGKCPSPWCRTHILRFVGCGSFHHSRGIEYRQ